MSSGISASTIKSWFQYRCPRKTRYDMMTKAERDSATIVKVESGGAWADEGHRFEKRVIARLRADQPVLGPPPGQDRLGREETKAFLLGRTPENVATQLALEQGPSLTKTLQLPDGLALNASFPDLVFRESTPDGLVFKIVDIKATRSSTPFHRAQVAFYALLLGGMIADLRIDASVNPTGEIWHILAGTPVTEGLKHPSTFQLKPYLRLVEEFLRRDAPRIVGQKVPPGVDTTFFHIYFKCEQCDYLSHCRTAISHADPALDDVSAIPGVSHEGKHALRARGLRTVGDLASRGLGPAGPTSWSLQRRSDAIAARAQALATSQIARLPDSMSYLMPPQVDRGFYLVADHDPVDDNLITLGYLATGEGARSVIRVIEQSSAEAERAALIEVFSALIEDLGKIDAHNGTAEEADQLHSHLFVFEPSEAKAIQAAIGRHLDDPQVRSALLHAVRLFPPERFVPEPEFKGAHHLPAAALRSVLEQLYALPCKVSYDLRQVSEILSKAGRIDAAYDPQGLFRREFSSLLSVEVSRSVRERRRDRATVEQVMDDVRSRLETSAAIVQWLLEENAASNPTFLRLDKQPFRFQATLDPFAAADLDLLHAYELLDSRSQLLETLVRLAQPLRVRQQRGECLAALSLTGEGRHPNGRRWLKFSIPPESREAEISPDDIGVILTDDSPDLRLNMKNWPALEVRFQYGEGAVLFVNMSDKQYASPPIQRLLRNTGDGGWCLDKTFRDINGPRVRSFLQQLSATDQP